MERPGGEGSGALPPPVLEDDDRPGAGEGRGPLPGGLGAGGVGVRVLFHLTVHTLHSDQLLALSHISLTLFWSGHTFHTLRSVQYYQ